MNQYPELTKLIKLISVWHLTEVVKRESLYAWETAIRIIDTGWDLMENDLIEETENRKDTDLTAKVLSNPKNWGIADIEWQRMCQSWLEGHAKPF